MKLIFLIVGAAIGFGGGVYWGVHHPDQASSLSAAEEKEFLQAQIKASQAIRDKLDQISHSSASSGVKGFVSNFTSGSGSGTSSTEITTLRQQSDQQLQDLQSRLDKLK